MTTITETFSWLLLGLGFVLVVLLALAQRYLASRSPLAAFVLAGSLSILAVFTTGWPLALSALLFGIFLRAWRKDHRAAMQDAALRNMQAKDLGL